MKIAVAIATTGRPNVVAQTLQRLALQTRLPDHVVVVGAGEADFPSQSDQGVKGVGARFVVAAKGSSRQRNRALELCGTTVDVIVFLDDDFIPASDFVAGVECLMIGHPEISAASGHVLADGFYSAGVSLAEADLLIEGYEAGSSQPYVVDQSGVYGCNMMIRTEALARAPQTRFDENLPLYGWLEDLDFSASLAKVGRIVKTSHCVGVHLGIKSGRSPGVQLGYSQIANPLYLAIKGTMGRRPAMAMAIRNMIANLLRSMAPESYIDRRGRLVGNLLAFRDIMAGTCHPTRIMTLRSSRPSSSSISQVPR